MIIQNTAVLAGKLHEVDRKKNRNDSSWIRGNIRLAQGFRYMLDEVKQSRLDFNYTAGPGINELPKSEVILIGSIDRIVFDNGFPWNVLKVNNMILPNSSILKDLDLTFEEAKNKILEKDKEFIDKISDVNYLVKKQIETVLGSSNSFSKQMMNAYGDRAYERLVEDPWDMIHTIKYYTLEHGDKVAKYLSISLDDERRLFAQIRKAVMGSTQSTGNTFINEKEFNALYWRHFFGIIKEKEFKELVKEVTSPKEYSKLPIIKTDLGYHPRHLYQAEINSLNFLESVLYHEPDITENEEDVVKEVIDLQDFKPTKEQENVLRRALSDPIHILTGGPGTGKTTILLAVIQKIEKMHKNVKPLSRAPYLLISPTGKAASRMQEQTNRPASTIHSAFNLAPEMTLDEEMVETVVEKLQGIEYIIMDESSMLDSFLFGEMSKVLIHLPKMPKLLFVGDIDQLPPVGNGQVFRDISELIKRDYPDYFTELTEVKRQEGGSNIPEFARMIRDGQFPSREWLSQIDDIEFIDTEYNQLPTHLIGKVLNPRHDHLKDVQILTPYSSGDKGDTHGMISKGVAKVFNPEEKDEQTVYLGENNTPVRIKDRVLNTINLSKTIVNGSIGEVVEINNSSRDLWEWSITVDFNGEEYEYPKDEWDALNLAYAMTIHKSQGSEYDTVVIPILRGHSRFLSKNLLYTGATRARKTLVLLGSYNTFTKMAKEPILPRRTALSGWLKLP